MRDRLLRSFEAAVAAADPRLLIPAHLPVSPRGRTRVVGAGKAAAAMALALEAVWPPELPLDGVVLTRYRHGLPTSRIRVVEGGHPLPDAAGEAAAREIVRSVESLRDHDLLVVLLSGGGSALLGVPADGVSLADMRQVTNDLLGSGAEIQEINTVRKHLTATLGGQLAALSRAPILALIISDVTGDDPTHIASGPCAPDPTTFEDALGVLGAYGIALPPSVRARLDAGIAGTIPETPKPGSAVFAQVENRVIATARRSLDAAGAGIERSGMRALVLGDSFTGEASLVGQKIAAIARDVRARSAPSAPPVALISGGECTVTLRGPGRGGRCGELLLSLLLDLDGLSEAWAMAADTDGIDGTEDNAGAIVTPDSLARARAAGLDPAAFLRRNDSYGFFSALSDLVVTGPTRTNVNEYRIVIV